MITNDEIFELCSKLGGYSEKGTKYIRPIMFAGKYWDKVTVSYYHNMRDIILTTEPYEGGSSADRIDISFNANGPAYFNMMSDQTFRVLSKDKNTIKYFVEQMEYSLGIKNILSKNEAIPMFLRLIKTNNPQLLNILCNSIINLKFLGYDWTELDVIQKSLDNI